MDNLNFRKALYFGLPVRVASDSKSQELVIDCGFIVGLLLPMLAWIETRFSDGFSFRVYPDDCSYWKALYYFLFKPEKFDQ